MLNKNKAGIPSIRHNISKECVIFIKKYSCNIKCQKNIQTIGDHVNNVICWNFFVP